MHTHKTPLPAIEELRRRFEYQPEIGVLINLITAGGSHTGKTAGSVCRTGKTRSYVIVKVAGKTLYAHRVIWAMQTGKWPPEDIDHINGDSLDNRWDNLREATRSQNMHNVRWNRHAPGSTPGVLKQSAEGWYARIRFNGKSEHLGVFPSEEEAGAAYQAARRRYGLKLED